MTRRSREQVPAGTGSYTYVCARMRTLTPYLPVPGTSGHSQSVPQANERKRKP